MSSRAPSATVSNECCTHRASHSKDLGAFLVQVVQFAVWLHVNVSYWGAFAFLVSLWGISPPSSVRGRTSLSWLLSQDTSVFFCTTGIKSGFVSSHEFCHIIPCWWNLFLWRKSLRCQQVPALLSAMDFHLHFIFMSPFSTEKWSKASGNSFLHLLRGTVALHQRRCLDWIPKKWARRSHYSQARVFQRQELCIYIYTYDIITYMKHKYMLGKMTWKGGGCQRPLFRSGLFPGVNCPHHPKQEGIQATWHQRSRHCCFSFCSCFCLVDVWGNTALVSCLWLLVSRKVLGFFVCSSFWCVRS